MSLLEQVKEAGIIGAGGAGFPTHVKLNAEAEYILLNGAECEPLLRVDQQLMAIYPEKIIAGLYLAGKQVNAKKAIIGIKVKHKKAIEILRNKITEMELDGEVEVGELPDVYPAGDEQVLVYELTGRVVPEQGIPLNVGCVVINTETALNIFNATNNQPVIEKYVTIAGAVPNPITVKVPVGTPIRELIALSGRDDLTGYQVVDGGPMMGGLMRNLDSFVTKKTKGLVILPDGHNLVTKKQKEMRSAVTLNKTACEQCRLCTDLCPRHLLGHSTVPHKMVRATSVADLVSEEDIMPSMTCCQCNLCEYFSCPAGINPKMANVYFMTKLKMKGVKFQRTIEEYQPPSLRKYRMIPSKRLIARIGVSDYDKAAPLDLDLTYEPKEVAIALGAHVGVGAEPIVSVGDEVKAGDKIGQIPEGKLSACSHASIDGTVVDISKGRVVIRRK